MKQWNWQEKFSQPSWPCHRREVLPYAPDAWYAPNSVKVGYAINFNFYFYKPKALRSLDDIRADLLAVEKEAEGLLAERTAKSALSG